jgi:hypothetical protein
MRQHIVSLIGEKINIRIGKFLRRWRYILASDSTTQKRKGPERSMQPI